MWAADDFKAIRDVAKVLREGKVIPGKDYNAPKPAGTLASCQHNGCGRTVERPVDSPCTGACGMPPGGRAGKGPNEGWDCG